MPKCFGVRPSPPSRTLRAWCLPSSAKGRCVGVRERQAVFDSTASLHRLTSSDYYYCTSLSDLRQGRVRGSMCVCGMCVVRFCSYVGLLFFHRRCVLLRRGSGGGSVGRMAPVHQFAWVAVYCLRKFYARTKVRSHSSGTSTGPIYKGGKRIVPVRDV